MTVYENSQDHLLTTGRFLNRSGTNILLCIGCTGSGRRKTFIWQKLVVTRVIAGMSNCSPKARELIQYIKRCTSVKTEDTFFILL